MANRAKGEVSVTTPDGPVTLILNYNALCEIEDVCDCAFPDFLGRIEAAYQAGAPSMRDLRVLLWGSMLEHQPGASLRDAGRLAEALGEALGETIKNVITASSLVGTAEDDAPGKTKGQRKKRARPSRRPMRNGAPLGRIRSCSGG